MKHLLILGGAVAVLFWVARGTVIPGPYTYDEPDYMYAVSLGWGANALDSPSLSLREFVKLGLGRGRDAGAKTELSETIRDSGDVVFYRHWHGPVYSDWLSLVKHFTSDERLTRRSNFIFPIIAAVLMYFGTIRLLPGATGQTAAILCSVLYLWSYPVVRSTELGPHQMFATSVTAALLLLAMAFEAPVQRCRNYWYAAVVITAIAFCLLEVAFALVLTLLICAYLLREHLKPDAAFALRSLAWFVGTVLILWPAGLLKLSFIKAYFFMAYLAVFRSNAWGAGATISGTWWLRFVQSPVPWILAAIGVLYFVRRRQQARVLIPFAVFTLAMAAAIFPVKTEMARYALPLWPGVVLFAGVSTALALSKSTPVVRFAAIVFLSVAMLATSWPSLRSRLPRRDTRSLALIAMIRDRGLAHETLLVPHEDIPMLHYYFYGSRFKQYYDEGTIQEQIRSGGIDGVIDRADPPHWTAVPARP